MDGGIFHSCIQGEDRPSYDSRRANSSFSPPPPPPPRLTSVLVCGWRCYLDAFRTADAYYTGTRGNKESFISKEDEYIFESSWECRLGKLKPAF